MNNNRLSEKETVVMETPGLESIPFYADRVFDGWNPVFERAFDIYSELPLSETVYVWGTDLSGSLRGAGGVGGLFAVNRDGDWYVPLYDTNGNVTAYVSESGTIVAEYEYDAFGNTISQSGSLSDDFRHRFSTKPWIASLGVYDYGERLYSPELRRWLSRDPIGEEGGVNLYAFCNNSAVNSIDVLGKTKYWNNYLNNVEYPRSPDVWEKVGGRLFWSFLTISGYYNSCAIRVSRSLILSGHSITAAAGREKNFDIKAEYDVERDGKAVKKGDMLKAESPNARFVINARNIAALLDEFLTDSSIKKDSWHSTAEAEEKAECIRKENGEAFFADDRHAGMIKKGCRDPLFPAKSNRQDMEAKVRRPQLFMLATAILSAVCAIQLIQGEGTMNGFESKHVPFQALADSVNSTNGFIHVCSTNSFMRSVLLSTLWRILVESQADDTIDSCTIHFHPETFLTDIYLQDELQCLLSQKYPAQMSKALKSSGNLNNPQLDFLYGRIIPALRETPAIKAFYPVIDACGYAPVIYVSGGEKIQIRRQDSNGTRFTSPETRIYSIFTLTVKKKCRIEKCMFFDRVVYIDMHGKTVSEELVKSTRNQH